MSSSKKTIGGGVLIDRKKLTYFFLAGLVIIVLGTTYLLHHKGSVNKARAVTAVQVVKQTSQPQTIINPVVMEAAQNFVNLFISKDYDDEWSELAPQAQEQWPSRQARDAMLQEKFSDAAITNITLQDPIPNVTWTAPESPLNSLSGVWKIPLTVTFSNPNKLLPIGVAKLFSMTSLYVEYNPSSEVASILGEGPASMDAPIIIPSTIVVKNLSVPIFMYHLVDSVPSPKIEPSQYAWQVEVGLTTLPSEFDAEMAYANKIGAHSISLQHLTDGLLYGLPLAPNSFVITFDDGRLSQWTNAVPVLKKYNFTAVFFPCTGLIGQTVGPQTYMTAAQLQSLANGGFSVQDHTIDDGKSLWNLSPQQLKPLTDQTLSDLENLTGDPVQFIAYTGVWPWPTATQGTTQEKNLFQTLASYGYVGGLLDLKVDSETDQASSLWQLPRVRVGLSTGLPFFESWFSSRKTENQMSLTT